MEYCGAVDDHGENDLSSSSSTSSLNSNLSARPKGLSNEEALSRYENKEGPLLGPYRRGAGGTCPGANI